MNGDEVVKGVSRLGVEAGNEDAMTVATYATTPYAPSPMISWTT